MALPPQRAPNSQDWASPQEERRLFKHIFEVAKRRYYTYFPVNDVIVPLTCFPQLNYIVKETSVN